MSDGFLPQASHASDSSHTREYIIVADKVMSHVADEPVYRRPPILAVASTAVFLVCNHLTKRPCWGVNTIDFFSKNLRKNRV